jgi:hypothetical protein
MKQMIIACLFLALVSGPDASAFKDAGNRAYVQSGPDGVIYARAIPAANQGETGTTAIYRVREKSDELIDHYDWYTKHGLSLGWSPIAGKVAVLAVRKAVPASLDRQVELSLYVGGVLIRDLTSADLKQMGAEIGWSPYGGERASFQVMGCEQIPGTNDYVFRLAFGKDRTVSINILNGQPVSN